MTLEYRIKMFNICDFVRLNLSLVITIRKTSQDEHDSSVSKRNLTAKFIWENDHLILKNNR